MKRTYIFGVLCLMIATICCSFINNAPVLADTNAIDISAKAGFLMDYNSGEVIYEKNADAKLPVASMVKLMTILLSFEAIDNNQLTLDTMITTSENASGMGGSQVFIDPFVEYKAEDLIKSVIMASANDASVALAEFISGSEEAFVSKMNQRAKELGMLNTVYKNCTGLPAPEQYSTARDSALLLKELLKHDNYHQYSTIWMDKLVHPSGRETELVNTNKLIRYFKGCDSGKTGSTSEAGYCLTSSALRGDMRLISSVVGSKTGKDRFNDSSKLLNYGFSNFENKMIVNSNVSLKSVVVKKSVINEVSIYPENSYFALAKKGSESGYEVNLEVPDSVVAPIKNGEIVGKIIVTKNGSVIKEINVVVHDEIKALGFVDGFKKAIKEW